MARNPGPRPAELAGVFIDMKPKRHLADASAFWTDLGVSVEEQAEMASWAFSGAPVPEPERVELWENNHRGWNSLAVGSGRERPRLPGTVRLEALQRLAEYGLLN